MRNRFIAALALGSLPAVAQGQGYQSYPTPTVQQPRDTPGGPQRDAARVTLIDCLASDEAEDVDALLATQPGTPAEREAIRGLTGPRAPCRRDMSIADVEALTEQPRFLRGMLAQARYLARWPDAAPPSIASAAPSEIAVEIYNARVTAAADQPSELIRIFGDCVAAVQPMTVDALVRAEAGSAAETSAIGAVNPAMGPCLWNGQSIQFSRQTLRAALADGLYRKAIALPVGAGP